MGWIAAGLVIGFTIGSFLFMMAYATWRLFIQPKNKGRYPGGFWQWMRALLDGIGWF